MINVVGIDYSLSCPALCIFKGKEWNFKNCVFHFLSTRKKDYIVSNQFNGTLQFEYFSAQERYFNIAKWATDLIQGYPNIFIEDYSYGSKGKVFHIAENAGELKMQLYKSGRKFELVAPTVIKKFGAGKGNSPKEKMSESFQEENKFSLEDMFDCKKGNSPCSDIIDAYYLAKYGFFQLTQK